ncbi:MAG: hypothetical protein GTO02_22910, partial [Candidatus Dadabacteria bacterium]|nr:hypothetical protein [Candidatus Dadabacteria bacterium]NIQ17125.1 hypothetical protein [Candidatus Dadabacteria bacterium]
MEFIKNKKVLLSAISLFIFSFIVYFPSLSNDFVWDDVALIERSVSKFESGSISKLFIPDIKKNKNTTYYRPAIVLSYISDNYFWGKNPFGFHLTNNFIFSINVLLVFVLSFILLKGLKISSYYLIAVISALFFALHPVHVESVSWISGRTDLLCGMFFSLASIFHLSIMNRSYFIPISVLCFMLALFSKETALAFPFVVFFIDIVRRSLNKEQLLTYIFYLFLILIYFNIRSFPIELTNITKSFSSALGISAYFFQDIEIINELLKLLSANLYYITTLIAPFNLNAFIAELPGGNFYVLGAVLYFLLLIFIFF